MRVMAAGKVIDVVRGLGKSWTEGVHQAFQTPEQRLVGSIYLRETLTCGLGSPGKRRKIDPDGLAVSTTSLPPTMTECTALPSSVWTIWLVGSLLGDPIDVREIEEHQVRLVTLGDLADLVAEAQRARTAGGGGFQDLLAL